MKRTFVILTALALIVGGAFAQVPDLVTPFQDFTAALTPALPVNATTGTAWSDAYIGQFPHFGVGLAVGATSIPMDSVSTIISALGVDSASITGLDKVLEFGLPVPAAALTARLGGLILPFDVGAKIGTIPEQLADDVSGYLPEGSVLSYFLVGADVRFPIMQQGRDFADVSVGVALDYLDGSFSMPLATGAQSFSFTDPSGDPHTIEMTAPELFLDWNTVAADLTIQASKRILILTPYIGAGLSFGKPSLSTGLAATTTLDGVAVTQADIDAIIAEYESAGQPVPAGLDTFTANGYGFAAAITDWYEGMDYRVYGGLSLDILFIRVDLTASYNFVGKNFGATVGTRVQF